MNGPIAQLAALTCHANAFLGGRDFPAFFPDHSTCQFCDSVDFVERQRTLGPDEWIHALPEREVDGLRLTFEPRDDPAISDRMSAGFVGGGRVALLEVRRDDGQSEFWTSDWTVWDQDAPDQRIWQVTYRLRDVQPSETRVGRNLAVVKSAFRAQLKEVLQFSERHTQGAFTDHFSEALAVLDNADLDVGYHKDLALPGQLGDDARALLKAAMRAWVFGGMGSWNDMAFEQPAQTEYEDISDGLFSVVHEAIATAVNSTFLTS